MREFPPQADHCHASSPCQGFSTVNTSGGKNDKVNNELCRVVVRGSIEHKINTVSFENVTGMLQDKHLHYPCGMIIDWLVNDYQVRLGGKCTVMRRNRKASFAILTCWLLFPVVDSAHYGDPQSRKRVIILASRKPWTLPELPTPTHGVGLLPIRTTEDAIGDLAQIQPRKDPPGLTNIAPRADEGNKHDAIWVEHHVLNSKANEERGPEFDESDVLEPDKPANTVRCKNVIKHYSLNRACTNLERARLFSFPDDWEFVGNHTQVQKQIGNAVPIKLATAIARTIRDTCYVENDIFGSSEEQETFEDTSLNFFGRN